jgi:hypothetical protein
MRQRQEGQRRRRYAAGGETARQSTVCV